MRKLDLSTFICVVSTVAQVTLTSMDAALNLQVYWRIEEIITWIRSFLPLRFLLIRIPRGWRTIPSMAWTHRMEPMAIRG